MTDITAPTLTYAYVDMADADPNWVCTARCSTDCHGKVLKVETRRDGNDVHDGHGVCQRQSHRQEVGARIQADGYRLDDPNSLAIEQYPFIADHLIERTQMRLNQNPLQQRAYEYLTASDSSYRRTALRELEDNGAFCDDQDEARTRELMESYLSAQWDRGTFCHAGIERFRQGVLSPAVETSTTEPEEATVPDTANTTPFFADQRWVYTAEALQRDEPLNVPADAQFVSVPALLGAIEEYQQRFELCDAGVGEFLDEFGLSLTRERAFDVQLRNENGDRIGVVSFTLNTTAGFDIDDHIADGDIDQALNEALDDYLREHLPEEIFDTIMWRQRFDSYTVPQED